MAALNGINNFNGYDELNIFGDDSSKIKTSAVRLSGNTTDILLCDYSDRQLLIITQFQKIGTLISVTKGTTRTLNGSVDVYDVKTLCGLDSEEYHLAARYLAEQLNIVKPILFGICMKDTSLNTLKSLVKFMKDNLFF